MMKSEAEKKQKARKISIYTSIVFGIFTAYLIAYADALTKQPLAGLVSVAVKMAQLHFLFWPTLRSLIYGVAGGIIVGAIAYIFLSFDTINKQHYQDDAVAGTGGFMSKKEMERYKNTFVAAEPPVLVPEVVDGKNVPIAYDKENDKKMYPQTFIMSNNFARPIDNRALPEAKAQSDVMVGNNSVLVVGGAGSGKSRFVIKPNLLQMNASYVITDPSGEMVYSLGNVLRDHGYIIKIFNISDMNHSNRYNPLAYVRDDAGVGSLIDCFIRNTTEGKSGGGDNQFFVDAEKLLYSACIYYLRDFEEDVSRKNFATIMQLINMSSVNENNSMDKSELDKIFDDLPDSSLASQYYKAFKQAAGKTLKSIIISCMVRLRPFFTPEVNGLTCSDDLHLERIGTEKTALFIITPQADRTYSFLASMLYTQLFETLYHIGEEKERETGDARSIIPVRCMMDEFANIGEVPEFPSKLSTMRKYNISATVVLQDISQIEAMYEKEWKTLVANCSTTIFLGSPEPETLKYFSEKLGKETIRSKSSNQTLGSKGSTSQGYQNTAREVMTAEELGRMPAMDCIIYTQNMRPVYDQKYNYERHPYYSQTADADPKQAFQYASMSLFDNTNRNKIQCLTDGMVKAEHYRTELKKREAKLEEANKKEATIEMYGNLGSVTEQKKVLAKQTEDAVAAVFDKEKSMIKQNNIICITVRGVQINNLPTLVRNVAKRAHLAEIIIVDDLLPDGHDEKDMPYLLGIGYGQRSYNVLRLWEVLDLQRIDNFTVFQLSRRKLDELRKRSQEMRKERDEEEKA